MDIKQEAAMVVRAWLRGLMQRYDVTAEEIARRCDPPIAATTITRPLKDDTITLGWSTVYAIAAAMHELPPLPTSQTVWLKGEADWWLPPSEDDPRVPSAIRAELAVRLARPQGELMTGDILYLDRTPPADGAHCIARFNGSSFVAVRQGEWLLPRSGDHPPVRLADAATPMTVKGLFRPY